MIREDELMNITLAYQRNEIGDNEMRQALELLYMFVSGQMGWNNSLKSDIVDACLAKANKCSRYEKAYTFFTTIMLCYMRQIKRSGYTNVYPRQA